MATRRRVHVMACRLKEAEWPARAGERWRVHGGEDSLTQPHLEHATAQMMLHVDAH